MPVQQRQTKAIRRRYSAEFKSEALGLAGQVGVADAAKQLGLHESQLYARRTQPIPAIDRPAGGFYTQLRCVWLGVMPQHRIRVFSAASGGAAGAQLA